MLAKARNDHATEFQTSMGMYFLACGTSRSLFPCLTCPTMRASLCHIYASHQQTQAFQRTTIDWDKEDRKEQGLYARTDNLNIAFKVSEQRHDSKDHCDNGTTATLVPLYGVKYGKLPSSQR